LRTTKNQKQLLERYKEALINWNNTHNLIAKSQTDLLDDHINDSLSVVGYLSNNIIDLGSGAGFPGIPIALTSKDKSVFLVESNNKKAAFLLHTVNALGLSNTRVFSKKLEAINPQSFPTQTDIVVRAFGTVKKTLEASKKILDTTGAKLKIMTAGEGAVSDLPPGYEVTDKQKLLTKPHYKERFLVTIEKAS